MDDRPLWVRALERRRQWFDAAGNRLAERPCWSCHGVGCSWCETEALDMETARALRVRRADVPLGTWTGRIGA